MCKINTQYIPLFFSVVILVAASCSHASDNFVHGSWRYKMTVTVETPEGLRTGSAVREVSASRGISLFPEGTPKVSLKGEAVVVDLGDRGALFALLSGYRVGTDHAANLPGHTYFPKGGWLSGEGIRKMSALKAGPTELPPEWYPKLVHFKDKDDPTSIEMVVEMEPCADPKTGRPHSTVCITKDRFEEIFGKGVRLKSISIEMTDDLVVMGKVKSYLRWYRESGHSLGLKHFDPNNAGKEKYIISDEFQTRGD